MLILIAVFYLSLSLSLFLLPSSHLFVCHKISKLIGETTGKIGETWNKNQGADDDQRKLR